MCTRLGITPDLVRELVRNGLPRTGRGAGERFNLERVHEWLERHGYAERRAPDPVAPPEQVARTYGELARALGMRGTNAERTIGRWVLRPDFPGKPRTPGRRDAYLPVETIRAWLAHERLGGELEDTGDDENRALQRRLLRLKLEREEREALQELGRLADVDQVAQWVRQCVANARAILDTIPEIVAECLPAALDRETRANVFRQVQHALDQVTEEVARMVAGESDDEKQGT